MSYILTHFWVGWNFNAIGTEQFLLRQMPVAVGAIILLECGESLQSAGRLRPVFTRWPIALRWSAYVSMPSLALSCSGFIARHSLFIFNSDRLISETHPATTPDQPGMEPRATVQGEEDARRKPGSNRGTQEERTLIPVRQWFA